MTATLEERPAEARPANGGGPARRAVVRWAWRLFWREWRQQLLVLALIVVATAATIVGAAVAVNTPAPANAGFGTAQDLATFQGSGAQIAAQIAALQHRVGRVDVIENQTLTIPGSIDTYDLRAQNPHGAYGQPMLSLVSGHYPTGAGQVAVTSGVASAFGLRVGGVWHQGGQARRVTGIVQNPQSLLDEFALVVPGQVTAPTQVTVLFDAHGVRLGSLGKNVESRATALAAQQNVLNPETIAIAAITVGMLLIGLVSVGGFTVLAQRRLRSLAMLGAIGATDKNIRRVVRANGAVVGLVGAVIGFVLGLAAWLAYRPHVEASAHHVIGMFQLPWLVIAIATVLAVVATFLAASRPARTVTRIPVVTALAGRPAPPKKVRRWAVPVGIVFGVIAFFLLGRSAATALHQGGAGPLVLGFVAMTVALICLAPLFLTALARLGRRSPIAVRLALSDLARYRARSGSALGAISLGVMIAVIICVASAARYANVLDYAGPNLSSNQLIVYTSNGPYGPAGPGVTGGPKGPSQSQLRSMAVSAHHIAAALGGGSMVELESTSATLQHAASGRNWSGPLYVATPQLLRAFGITASDVNPAADILTMRPGLATTTKMQLVYGNYFGGGGRSNPNSFPCPASECLANPVMQTVNALPAGTSAPNTVITEHAVSTLHLKSTAAGWLIQVPHPLTAAQIHDARLSAAAASMNVETRSSVPSLGQIINTATAFGILLALGILAMSVGLIRSETASDLRTLTATGASSTTRRNLTAATAGALALLGAVLGTAAGYLAAIAWFRDSALNGGIAALTSVPTANLLVILVGMPLIAAVAGWLLAGREPRGLAHQPME
jgi:putative ABC transport system permease protein